MRLAYRLKPACKLTRLTYWMYFFPSQLQSVIKIRSNTQRTLKSYMSTFYIYFIKMDWIQIFGRTGKYFFVTST